MKSLTEFEAIMPDNYEVIKRVSRYGYTISLFRYHHENKFIDKYTYGVTEHKKGLKEMNELIPKLKIAPLNIEFRIND